MVVLRLTQKVRRRLGKETEGRLIEQGESTTVLGDWYANLISCGRERLVLYTSSTTLLPVVCPAKNLARNIGEQLRVELGHLLLDIGVDESAVRRELAEMKVMAFAKTADRRVLGSMTEFAFMTQHSRARWPDEDLGRVSRWLADTPCGMLGDHMSPDNFAVELLGGSLRRNRRLGDRSVGGDDH